MLVLKRKVGQRIRIGMNIFVTVTDSGYGYAKIGVDAPRGVSVVREEVDDARVVYPSPAGRRDDAAGQAAS